jgi:hypothetical protein
MAGTSINEVDLIMVKEFQELAIVQHQLGIPLFWAGPEAVHGATVEMRTALGQSAHVNISPVTVIIP